MVEESKCYHLDTLTKDEQLFAGNSVESATSFRTTAFIWYHIDILKTWQETLLQICWHSAENANGLIWLVTEHNRPSTMPLIEPQQFLWVQMIISVEIS